MLEEKLSDRGLEYRINDLCEIGIQLTRNEDYENLKRIADDISSLLLEYSLRISKKITDTKEKKSLLEFHEEYNYISWLIRIFSGAQKRYGITNAPEE